MITIAEPSTTENESINSWFIAEDYLGATYSILFRYYTLSKYKRLFASFYYYYNLIVIAWMLNSSRVNWSGWYTTTINDNNGSG